jgi:N-acyl amino acid synthase of PEP-CTERM/exosortase system
MATEGEKPLGCPNFAPYFCAMHAQKSSETSTMERAFALRFDVYCTECGFLVPEQYPDRRERDEYDDGAAHFLSHNDQNELVGYVRLIQGTPGKSFPWQQYCPVFSDGDSLPDPLTAGEISRLMVRGDYRRRRNDLLSGVNPTSELSATVEEGRRKSPQILLSLYRQMYQHSVKVGIRYWYAAMERPLARSLLQMGFSFRQLGPEADYFGPVATYLADLRELESTLEAQNPELFTWMRLADSGRD